MGNRPLAGYFKTSLQGEKKMDGYRLKPSIFNLTRIH